MEVELKLSFPAQQVDLIHNHPLIAGGVLQGEPETLESTYFDTPGLDLNGDRIALRVRQTAQGKVQTVKCAAKSVGGLSSRPEWEQAFSGTFDFSGVEDETVRRALESLRERLIPVFSTVFRRETRQLAPRPGVRVLVMIDSGQVITAGAVAPISELELELAAGDAEDLRDIAIELAASLPLIPFDQSKAERGYRMFRGEALRPLKAGRTSVRPEMTPAEAFQVLADQGLQCWQANLHGALASTDPEFVHQFRVALRRLNTMMCVFEPVLPAAFLDTWSTSLKSLAAVTGELRDLDVMRETILLPMQGQGDSPDHEALVSKAVGACDDARGAANTAIDELTNGLPLLRFARDMASLPVGASNKTVTRFAEKRLARMHRRAVKRLHAARHHPVAATAHRLRISFKHLRYSCEFFASLFDEAAMLRYAKRIAGLQDDLGFINDLHVALSRLGEWSARDEALVEVRDYIAAWYTRQFEQKLAAALERAEDALGQCMPWCGECERRGRHAGQR